MHEVYKVMTGIHTLLLFKKKRKWKKFKIVKMSLQIPLKHDICGLLLEWYWPEYLSNHFWYRILLWQHNSLRHGKKSKSLVVLNLTPICISSNVQYNDEWFVCIVVTGRRDNLFLITSRILNNVSKPTALVRVWINKPRASLQNQFKI